MLPASPDFCNARLFVWAAYAFGVTMAGAQRVGVRYVRPTEPVRLSIEPQLASWEAAGHPSQVWLAQFLDHVEEVVAPTAAAAGERLAVELVVGLPKVVSPIGGGRDLDNYLFPIAQRLGAARLAAVFGRKVFGTSLVAMSAARSAAVSSPPQFTTRMVGSYIKAEWKDQLRAKLLQAAVQPAPPGPVAMDVAVTTGPGRNWANLWKPLLDSFGPVLGEDPARPFNPDDDRIVSLGLHHNVDPGLGYDVMIDAWWSAASEIARAR